MNRDADRLDRLEKSEQRAEMYNEAGYDEYAGDEEGEGGLVAAANGELVRCQS